MLAHIIGIDAFKEGLHNYLNSFKYSNADQSDLWKHLQAASDKNVDKRLKVNVTRIMDSWTLKEGYPLITVTRDYETNKVRFSQRRFLLNGKDKDALIRTQYEVPITYTTKSEQNWVPNTRLWLQQNANGSESYAIETVDVPNDGWVIANLQETGFYRVNYDQRNWELLVNQLLTNHSEIHAINRAQILDDLFHLAENGVVKYELALRALEYLKNENDSLGWTSVSSLTYLINKMLRRTESYGNWQAYVRKLIKPGYDKFKMTNLDNDNLLDNQMQKTLVSMACAYNLDDCVENAKRLFNEFMGNVLKGNSADENNIPPNVRSSVYCTAIYHGGELEWNFIFQLYLKEQNANERNALLVSLTCSRVPWILARYLKWMFDESSGIKTQDAVFTFKAVATQNYGKDIAFNFLRENWVKIHSILGKQMSFGHIVKSLDSINSAFELELVREFFYRTIGNKVGSAKRAFLQTIEQIESNISWMKSYEHEIAEFLEKVQRNQQ